MLHQNLKTKSLPSSGPKLKVTNVSIQGVPQNTRAPRPRTHARARRNSILSAEKGQATAGGGCRPRRSCSETRAAGRRNGNRVYDSSAEPGRTPVHARVACRAVPPSRLPRALSLVRRTARTARDSEPGEATSAQTAVVPACLTYLDRLRRPVRRCRSGGRSHEPRVSWKPAYTATYSAP